MHMSKKNYEKKGIKLMEEQEYLKEIRDKLDKNLTATAEVRKDIAVLATAVEGHDRANEEYKRRTDKELDQIKSESKQQFESLFDRVHVLEESVSADSTNRDDMKTFRSSAIRWVITVLGGMIVTFGGGVTFIAYQVSKISGVG